MTDKTEIRSYFDSLNTKAAELDPPVEPAENVPKRKVGKKGSPSKTKISEFEQGSGVALPGIEVLEHAVQTLFQEGHADLCIERLNAETAPSLLCSIIKQLTLARDERGGERVRQLLTTHPNRMVKERSIQYLARLNRIEDEDFLQMSAASQDPLLRELALKGCVTFDRLSPERNFLEKLLRAPSEAATKREGVRLSRFARLVGELSPDQSKQVRMELRRVAPEWAAQLADFELQVRLAMKDSLEQSQADSDGEPAASGAEGVQSVPPIFTTLTSFLVEHKSGSEWLPEPDLKHFQSAGVVSTTQALYLVGRTVWRSFFERLLHSPAFRSFAFALLSHSTEFITAAQSELAWVAEHGLPVEQIEAMELLEKVQEVTVSDAHLQTLHDPSFMTRSAWISLVARRRAMDLMFRWDSLPAPVLDVALSTWLAEDSTVALRLLWMRTGDWLAAGKPAAAARTLLGLAGAVGVRCGGESVAPILRQVIPVILLTEGQAALEPVIHAVSAAQLPTVLFEPALLTQLSENLLQQVVLTMTEGWPPIKKVNHAAALLAVLPRTGRAGAANVILSHLLELLVSHPDLLPEGVAPLTGHPLCTELLQRFGQRVAHLVQAERFLNAELNAAHQDARRAVAKAIAPALANLEYFLQQVAPEAEEPYQRKVLSLVAEIRTALGNAGLHTAVEHYGLTPFNSALHRLTPPAGAPSRPVRVMALGLRLSEESAPVDLATVILPKEETEE
jgi:hypothetical protein